MQRNDKIFDKIYIKETAEKPEIYPAKKEVNLGPDLNKKYEKNIRGQDSSLKRFGAPMFEVQFLTVYISGSFILL